MSKVAVFKRTYPWNNEIKGKQFIFRPFERKDRDAALKFAQELPKDDLLFLTIDITDPKALDEWLRSSEENRSISILAETEGRFVGYGSLTYNQLLWTRHLGEIRLLVSSDYRGYGLGKILVNEIFALAQELGLQKLVARMASEQKSAIQVFERLGFKAEALLADQVIDREGRTHDLIIMSYDVTGFTE